MHENISGCAGVAVSKLNNLCSPWWLGAGASEINVHGLLLLCCPMALNALIVI